MIHLDLFSGIGGFAYAADQVFGQVEHIFCDNDKFCQQVLNKHWPEAKIYEDIRAITNTALGQDNGRERSQLAQAEQGQKSSNPTTGLGYKVDLLTGGFPCQPFSAAGLRRGTADDRHLWPEMLRVIRLTKPRWVIAENVRGLLNWNEGVVFEQVCTDLEAEDYTVQPFIIPAVAVNAPHRRDRVWFVAHRADSRPRQSTGLADEKGYAPQPRKTGQLAGGFERPYSDAKDAGRKRGRGRSDGDTARYHRQVQNAGSGDTRFGWQRDWLEVAARLCGVDDGISGGVDRPDYTLTKAGHRKERLKSLGNAIVPQVAIEIMKGMA